ncbi:hypothetical protein [Aurantiacibacter gangjinensis]|uniref:Uncharacterized protein n=1 Tax=Aurantiacibacter gangjinensis TaxID=502682 RepID=A0A0G9MRM5_9SPHN|nr:hypothetical protein [Aurantiacibacter gangjinensis]APE26936.1 hypothetical protein BMF35_a0107 [Aurantiacibacter gangjinensis]KLE33391.1 hypothetical protein AAW01_05535 [Aurantiacibacter gangjinensis]
MSVWAAIVLVVLIVVVARAYHVRRGNGLADEERSALEQERDEARREREALKKRLEVLERIATDPARRTADEIEKLRDE